MKLRAIDLFCGGGGTSLGAEQTGEVEIVGAVNHWDIAIDTHSYNFPGAVHFNCRVDQMHPRECPRGNILFASPECTEHSYANTWELTEESRCQPYDVLTWIGYHLPEWAVLENVPALLKWGPLTKNGRPHKRFRGRLFDGFLMQLRAYGYSVEYRILNSADFGAATSRERLFIIARRGLNRSIPWPSPTHASEADRIAGSKLPLHRGFSECIDPAISCPPITERARPLVPATLAKIARGNERYAGEMWLLGYYGSATYSPVHKPILTLTTHDRFALIDARSPVTGYRMIKNHEAAAAQGFPPNYRFFGSEKDITTQIGNSVPPHFSKAITQALLSV